MKKSIFNTRLKTTAKEQGYTQQTLAEKMYVSVETVKKWYTTTMPDLGTVRELANKLNVDVAFLLGDIECKHHEEQTIKDVTGLSEKACENLVKMKGSSKMAVLDGLLRNDKFLDVLGSICDERSEYFQIDPNYPKDYSDDLYPVGYGEYLANETRHEIAAYRYDISVKFQEAYTEIDSCTINALASDELQKSLNKLHELDDEPEQV